MKKLSKTFLILSLAIFVMTGAAFADNVTFKIDMTYLNSVGLFDPATEGAAIRGNMTDWHSTPDNLPDWSVTDADADLIYEGTFDVGTTSPLQYKFVIYTIGTTDISWEYGNNRQLVLTGADQVLDVVVWEIEITFSVDMSRAERLGLFDPAVNGVSLRGNFTDWNSDYNTLPDWALTDEDADKVYTGTFTGVNTSELAYKYVTTTEDTTLIDWEGAIDNRLDTLKSVEDVTLDVAFWDSIPAPATAITANVLFKVDVTPMLELGAFDPTLGDTLQIRGGFNGWSDSDPENSIMRESIGSLTQYELTVPITAVAGEELAYKFFIQYNDQNKTRVVPESGWEEPATTGGANRFYAFTDQVQQEVETKFFNDIFIEDVIPEGTTVSIELTANMKFALADAELGLPADGPLQMDAQDPIWRFISGTPNVNDDATALVYEDTAGDSVFTLTFDLAGPAPNWIQYKLQWAGQDEEGSDTQATGRRRVRYIRKNGDGTWPATFKMGLDVWNSKPGTPLVVEERDGEPIDDPLPTSVERELVNSAIPVEFQLNQNYPNPFNPTTTFHYAVQKASHVSIIVYNQLGQEVTRLVDSYQPAGTYKIIWNASDINNQVLPTGIYFYVMKAADFHSTRRLLLLK